MTDNQLAHRIVECFMGDSSFYPLERRNLETLFQIDLVSAFGWSETTEGAGFWCNLCETRLRTVSELHDFLKRNLEPDPNFIELELYI